MAPNVKNSRSHVNNNAGPSVVSDSSTEESSPDAESSHVSPPPPSFVGNKLHLPYPQGPYGVSMVDVLSYGHGKDGQMIRLLFPCDRRDVWVSENQTTLDPSKQ